jgi:hypothetical protein
MSDRELSPLFASKSAAVVGAGERAMSSGGRLWRTHGARQSQGRHDIRLRSVTSIAVIRRGCRVSAPAAAAGVETAGPLARYPRLRDGASSDNLSDVRFRDRRGA